ncbi:hypothetical protein [Pseudomonas panipatensis]|uniref:hypothetical protein n=1 Tax=Pseudomonas panipatensis TaxID=428992 RepID=UPI0035AFD8D3
MGPRIYMNKDQKKVVHLHQRDPLNALERLNRITGLQFSSWPESLIPCVDQEEEARRQAQPELGQDEGCRQLG